MKAKFFSTPFGSAVLLLALLAAAGSPTRAFSQGTAITYQGRLNNSGVPAAGIYDLQFAVYDSTNNPGVLIAGPLTSSAVPVSSGLFTVTVDFGPGIFTGPPRWLEIGVRTNGGGAFTVLSPRQPLTPAPYAIFANTASNIVNGSVVKSLNTLKDNVTLAAGTNVIITSSANTLTIAAAGAGGSGIWSVNASNTYYNAGNVGIGTSTPLERMTIAGVSSFNNGLKITGGSPNGTGIAIENTASGGHKYDLLAGGANDGIGQGSFGIWDETIGSYRFEIDGFGNVGIGPHLTFGGLGTNLIVNAQGVIQSAGGGLNLFTQSYLSGANPFAYLHLDNSGKVGIGSATPTSQLDIVGQDDLSLVGYNPFMTFWDSGAGYAKASIQSVAGGLNFFTDSYLHNVNNSAYLHLDNSGNLGIGTATPAVKLHVVGTTRTCVLNITGGCDLAEPFPMDQPDVAKGAVVVIDEKRPGQLKLSDHAYDTHVAGVVSGANGISAGISMEQEGVLATGQNVALTGRVYVQADATGGAIKPGDLLTTSDTPGQAMKVSDPVRAQGAILGKAMTPLESGHGLVLVLVTLQ